MSATVSHDIKNCLAIINEHAGLLQDLVQLGQKSGAVNLDRLNTLAEQMMRQVSRADEIVRHLNRFAHSPDVDVKEIDLVEIVQMLLGLCNRIIAQRGVEVALRASAEPIRIETRVFMLIMVVWQCIDFATRMTPATGKLQIIAANVDAGVHMRIVGVELSSAQTVSEFPTPADKMLLSALGASIRINSRSGEMTLCLPARKAAAGEGQAG